MVAPPAIGAGVSRAHMAVMARIWFNTGAMSADLAVIWGRMGAQVKTAPEPPVFPLRKQRVAVEGLANRYRGATD